jgi:hypothetical protein
MQNCCRFFIGEWLKTIDDREQIRTIPMRLSILIMLFLATADVGAAQPPRFTFKGVRLGMTYGEMRNLLARTSWDYRFDLDREDNIGSIDAVPYDASSPELDTLAILGCINSDTGEVCPKFLHIKAAFTRGRIYSILIRSPEFDAGNRQQLHDYVLALQRSIAAILGPGTEGEISLGELDMEKLSAINDGEYPELMVWKWKRPKSMKGSSTLQDASIYIEPQGLRRYSIVFSITDYRLLRK